MPEICGDLHLVGCVNWCPHMHWISWSSNHYISHHYANIHIFLRIQSGSDYTVSLSLPVVLCLQRCHPNTLPPHQTRAGCRRVWSLRFVSTLVAYLFSMTLTVAFLYLYYGLLLGGASMNGTKGVLFSLIPPVVVFVLGILIRYRFFKTRTPPSMVNQESKDTDNIINLA